MPAAAAVGTVALVLLERAQLASLTQIGATLVQVEVRNVTVSLPRELLRRVKVVAAKRDTSISALLVGAVEDIVRDDDAEETRRRLVLRARTGYDLGSGDSAVARADLHDPSM